VSTHVYRGEQGLGAPHADGPLHPEMRELDLHPGTAVTHLEHDAERGLDLIEWTDRVGGHRITSVTPDQLAELFEEV
jgi:hypothetical protein